jgi:hypothetical protein
VCFTGSLIWASDLDDNLVRAHQGLVGRAVRGSEESGRERRNTDRAASDVNKGLNEACRRLDGVCAKVGSPDTLVQNCVKRAWGLSGGMPWATAVARGWKMRGLVDAGANGERQRTRGCGLGGTCSSPS